MSSLSIPPLHTSGAALAPNPNGSSQNQAAGHSELLCMPIVNANGSNGTNSQINAQQNNHPINLNSDDLKPLQS